MGDMADFALECMEIYEGLALDFHTGFMDIVEAYEYGIVDELGFEDCYYHTEEKYRSLNMRAFHANLLIDKFNVEN